MALPGQRITDRELLVETTGMSAGVLVVLVGGDVEIEGPRGGTDHGFAGGKGPEDVGVRFESGPPATIRIHRKGRGRHMHEFVVPDEASAPPAHPVAASCAHELRGAPCPERRTFRLV